MDQANVSPRNSSLMTLVSSLLMSIPCYVLLSFSSALLCSSLASSVASYDGDYASNRLSEIHFIIKKFCSKFASKNSRDDSTSSAQHCSDRSHVQFVAAMVADFCPSAATGERLSLASAASD